MPRKKKGKGRVSRPAASLTTRSNFCHAHGCFVAHYQADFLAGVEAFDREEYGLGPEDAVPDISVDPEDGTLSVINDHKTMARSYFISTPHCVRDGRGRVMNGAAVRDENGERIGQTTLILVLKPQTRMEVGSLVLEPGQEIQLESDIKDVPINASDAKAADSQLQDSRASHADRTSTKVFPFPLGGAGPYLCSQGFGGSLTHFFPATWHALDLACPIGTPVLAVGNGTVTEVRDKNAAGGIAVRFLFSWNSVTLKLDDGTVVDYVHIARGSARVAAGDRVEVGQLICESGDVGFCPAPHLHFQVHESDASDAPTVPFALLARDGSRYVPKAGEWCGPEGIASPPPDCGIKPNEDNSVVAEATETAASLT